MTAPEPVFKPLSAEEDPSRASEGDDSVGGALTSEPTEIESMCNGCGENVRKCRTERQLFLRQDFILRFKLRQYRIRFVDIHLA